jgi:hypothetical protein
MHDVTLEVKRAYRFELPNASHLRQQKAERRGAALFGVGVNVIVDFI